MVEWKTVSIGSFLKEREGRFNPSDRAVQKLTRLNKIDFSGEIHLSHKGSKTDMIIVRPGDLVISGINVAKGALAVYHGEEPIAATIHYSSYSFDESKINIEYFKRFVKSRAFIQALKDQVKGGIKTEIKPKHFLPLEILLPGVIAQKEIVEFFGRVENEMSELGVEIDSQGQYLKMLKQMVLQEAIEGKLTADWRDENHDLISGDNHASKLLEKIKVEKDKLIKEGKIKKEKSVASITDDDKPFNVPEGWVWCRLGQVIYDPPRNGYSPKEVSYKTNVKSLKLGASTYGFFNPNEYKYVAEDIPRDSVFWLEPNDILIQRSNSIDYVGVSAIYTGKSKEFIYPDLMMKIRASAFLSTKLVHLFISSPAVRGYFRSKAKGSQQTMPKINQGVVIDALLPLPPVAEQSVIVESVDKITTMISDLEKQVAERKGQSESLMRSVLSEAFAG
ncbi:MAG: hypothetical protein PHY34_06110 [Patescibacteria group bacterium]|nr:hypothetical protein [Patescibacteria group bacterium]